MKIQRDSEPIVERISMSENEKEIYNNKRIINKPHRNRPNKDIYRYFSQSAKVDNDLFNYRKYFSDMTTEIENLPLELPINTKFSEPHKTLKTKRQPEGCTTQECSRCHKRIVLCNECSDETAPAAATAQRYNEPELDVPRNQQVVVYRHDSPDAPFSFNIDSNSVFYDDALENLKEYEEKLTKYLKHYGDLKRKKLNVQQQQQAGEIPKNVSGLHTID